MTKSQKKRKDAIREYITFMDVHVIHPVDDGSDNLTPKDIDSRRRKLHDAVCEAYMDEPYFKSEPTEYIKDRLCNFDRLPQILKMMQNDIENVVDYYYWYNEDKVNGLYCSKADTMYGVKTHIDESIASMKKDVEKMVERCQKIIDAYGKAREKYNEGKKWGSKEYCKRSFDHEMNAGRSAIEMWFRDMNQLAEMPIEAYLKIVVDRLYTEPIKSIYANVDRLRANAFHCLIYWKDKSGFWDKDFDF